MKDDDLPLAQLLHLVTECWQPRGRHCSFGDNGFIEMANGNVALALMVRAPLSFSLPFSDLLAGANLSVAAI